MVMLVQLISCVFLLSLCAPPSFSDVLNSGTFNKEGKDCTIFFLDNTPPEIPGILQSGAIEDSNVYKAICQKYENEYHFATLYDTGNKIPVFSAMLYTGKEEEKGNRNDIWRTESELVDQQATKEDYYLQSNQARTQAVKGGKLNAKLLMSEHDVNRGHLIPHSYGKNSQAAKSTCTLTNVVPQKASFNGGSWSQMEGKVKAFMDEHCKDSNDKTKAHVVTGAVPSTGTELKQMNGRVNVPKLMWSAMCCYNAKNNKWYSIAHLANNVPDEVGRTIDTISLDDLHKKPRDTSNYPSMENWKFFPDKCLENNYDYIVKKLKEYNGQIPADVSCCEATAVGSSVLCD